MPNLLSGLQFLERIMGLFESLSIYPFGVFLRIHVFAHGSYLWLFLMFCLFPFAAFADFPVPCKLCA